MIIKTDCCASCRHCVEVHDDSGFRYYYCVHEDFRLVTLNQWCDSFMGVNPKLLYKRPILQIPIGKQIKDYIESSKAPSMDFHIDNEPIELTQEMLASIDKIIDYEII